MSAKLEADEDTGAATAENWIGKLIELYLLLICCSSTTIAHNLFCLFICSCLRSKLSAPEYTFDEKTGAQGPWFIANCAVGKLSTTGEAKQKKVLFKPLQL